MFLNNCTNNLCNTNEIDFFYPSKMVCISRKTSTHEIFARKDAVLRDIIYELLYHIQPNTANTICSQRNMLRPIGIQALFEFKHTYSSIVFYNTGESYPSTKLAALCVYVRRVVKLQNRNGCYQEMSHICCQRCLLTQHGIITNTKNQNKKDF